MSTPHTSHTPFLPPTHPHARTPVMTSALQPHPTAFQFRPSPPVVLPSPALILSSTPLLVLPFHSSFLSSPSPPSPPLASSLLPSHHPPLPCSNPLPPRVPPPCLPQVNPSANVVVRGEEQRYVCRAGYKLEKGLQHFGIDVNGKVREELR